MQVLLLYCCCIVVVIIIIMIIVVVIVFIIINTVSVITVAITMRHSIMSRNKMLSIAGGPPTNVCRPILHPIFAPMTLTLT